MKTFSKTILIFLFCFPSLGQVTNEDILKKLEDFEILLSLYEEQVGALVEELRDEFRTEIQNTREVVGSQHLVNSQFFAARFRTLELMLRPPLDRLPAPISTNPENPDTVIELPLLDGKPLTSTFLRHNAQYSTHFFFSDSLTDAQREAELVWHSGHGYNTIHWYLWVDGDYGGHHKFNFTQAHVERVLYWIAKAREYGLEPVIWMMSDDGFRFFNRNDPGQVRQRWSLAIDTVIRPAQIRFVVLGLEALEYWSNDMTRDHGMWLKERLPSVTKLIFHTLNGDKRLVGEPWMDMLAWQSGFGFTAEEVAKQIRELRFQFPRLPIIAAEYHMSGETEEAKTIGKAALDAGAVGAWNGAFLNP